MVIITLLLFFLVNILAYNLYVDRKNLGRFRGINALGIILCLYYVVFLFTKWSILSYMDL